MDKYKLGNKYKLSDLKIVKYNTDEYYMCEYKNDTYTEIFTNKELEANSISKVEPLSDYYSILDILSGFYKGTLESLFWKYIIIMRHKTLLDYDKDDNLNNVYVDKDEKAKVYPLNKLCYVEVDRNIVKNGYKKYYICKYDVITNSYIEFFTQEKIKGKYVKSITPLYNNDVCYKYINYIDSLKVSSFNLLKIYNELNKLNIINNYTEDDIVEELIDNGVYEESKIYQKRNKVKTITKN